MPGQANRPTGLIAACAVQGQAHTVVPDLITDAPGCRYENGLLPDGQIGPSGQDPGRELAHFSGRYRFGFADIVERFRCHAGLGAA